jgi:hypothetical protein
LEIGSFINNSYGKREAEASLFDLLIGFFAGFDEAVDLLQESVAIDAVHHAGFLYGFPTGRGAAQTVHTDSMEQGSGVGSDVQHITDDGILFNLYSHDKTSYVIFFIISNIDKKIKSTFSPFSKKPMKRSFSNEV